jgi:protein kinase-like protein
VNQERWRQVNDLFHAALERDAGGRETFLREATAGDPELLREVQSLIDSSLRAGNFLDVPAYGVAPHLMFDELSLEGRRIGVYHVLEEVGRGGMGVVYAAEDERLGRKVALKALTPEYTRDPVRRERLTREARAAAALSHPSIATIYALEEIDGDLYIVSELVRGRTLREELGDGPLPLDRLLSTLIELASALAFAHRAGVVHRDLKPENIIRCSDGGLKILDFGLARFEGGRDLPTVPRLTETGMALGTPGYMAPEQLSGGQADARADLFAFGVIAWELATREHPFGADPAALLARMTDMLEGRASALSRPLPIAGLDAIARRCLRGNPAERYQTADELLVELRALTSSPSQQAAVVAADDRRWWWQFHQITMALVDASMPVMAWLARRSLGGGGPWGSRVFFATLALATIAVTLRLNLWFAARVQPESLVEHRARAFPGIVASELALAAVLLAAAAFVGETQEALAAVITIVAIASLASLVLIEPATTRGAGLSRR